MHLASRYGSSHNAVKLLCPRSLNSWRVSSPCRSFSTTSTLLDLHNPNLHPPGILGRYQPNATPNPQAKEIAVIGGGITGLATAFHLSRDLPNAKITVFENKERLGGWVDSEQVEVDDGSVLFEWGPRTLRPDQTGNGKATIQLLEILNDDIGDSILRVSSRSPAATNRYIYYPDHLVRAPGPNPSVGLLSNIFTTIRSFIYEPAYGGLLASLLAEPTIPCRPVNIRDESIGHFLRRRFGSAIADNLASALFHGIYAGDIYKLSARTLLPLLWHLENRDVDGNGVLAEMGELYFRGHVLAPYDKLQWLHRCVQESQTLAEAGQTLPDLTRLMRGVSVYTFVKGIGQLKDVLLDKLQANPNVSILPSSTISSLTFDSNRSKVEVKNSNSEKHGFDYAVCTVSQQALSTMLAQDNTQQTSLQRYLTTGAPKGVNVMVVNLYYNEESLPIPPGFGYLIPRSIPADQNPERALGVIFSSETAGPKGENAFVTYQAFDPKPEGQPEKKISDVKEMGEAQAQKDGYLVERKLQIGQDTASGSKLAVMLGGHWWDGWTDADLPSESEAIEMAKSVIQRHLGLNLTPAVAKARLQRNCIPQYQVGYRDAMSNIHRELVKDFQGRLKVGGVWWQGGVGVNDCVRSARETSRRIREAWDDQTGLEAYTEPEKFVLVDKRTGEQMMDPMQK